MDAWAELERLRWDGRPRRCPHCRRAERCRLLPGPVGQRRVWHCAACRSRFSVLSETALAGSRVPPQAWLGVLADAVTGEPAPVRALARGLGLSPPTVRLLRARLAAAGVRAGDEPDEAMRRLLTLPPDAVAAVRRVRAGARPGGAELWDERPPGEGPSADYR